MGKYNLINNGTLTSTTISGNTNLNWLDIESLHNGVTNSGIVHLNSSDIISLEVDLGNRIKVDNILLYTNDPNKEPYISFYYKNSITDEYSICNIDSNTEYYSAGIPEPSSPRYIKTLISGTNISINEFIVYNNDYIVGFGDNGTTDSISLDRTPAGSEGAITNVPLYNNSDGIKPTTAYATVDYTGNVGDSYIKISSSNEGPYYGIDDPEVSVESNSSIGWEWKHGSFNNTKVDNDKVVLSNISNSYPNKVTELPVHGYSYIVGTSACPWAYDPTTKILYVVTIETNSSASAKLRSYDFATNTWAFISSLPKGTQYASSCVSIAKNSNYIYITLGHRADQSNFWGRYDLNGPQDNFEWLPDPTDGRIISVYTSSILMLSVDNYIYIIVVFSGKLFVSYDVNTGNFVQLNYGFYHNTYYAITRLSLMHDPIRQAFYLDSGGSSLPIPYIQRYDIASNTWDTTYIPYVDRLGYDTNYMQVSYFNNKFYFKAPSYGNLMGVYDITTDTHEFIDVGYPMMNAACPRMLLVPKMTNNYGVTLLNLGITDDIYSIYGYNVPLKYNSLNYTSGTYTTPVFSLENKNMSSYFTISEETTEGISSVTKDRSTPDGTIEVISSNTKPTPMILIYWATGKSYNYMLNIVKYDVNTTSLSNRFPPDYGGSPKGATAVCRRTGRVFAQITIISNNSLNYAYIFDSNGSMTIGKYDGWTTLEQSCADGGADFTKDLGLWVYAATGKLLIRVTWDLSEITHSTNVSAYDIAVEEDGNGVWYTDLNTESLVHLDGNGVSLSSKILNNPTSICSGPENGCWVTYNNGINYVVCLYSYEGELKKTVYPRHTPKRLTSDFKGGFYYLLDDLPDGPNILHVNANGDETMAVTVENPYRLKGCPVGVVVRSKIQGCCWYIDEESGDVSVPIYPAYGQRSNSVADFPTIFYWDYSSTEKFSDIYGSNLLPLSYDPVWGDSSDWEEVPKNGYFLPKTVYHQARITLQSRVSSANPHLTGVYLPKAIKVPDIPCKDSKDFYLKTDIPVNVTDTIDYTAKIKAWWDIED